jgi:YgiT-type zinc finger domain-containing protein
MKCLHCQGLLEKGATHFHIDRNSCHVTLDDVPAWVCTQCGEALFDEKEVNAIQDLIQTIDQKTQQLRLSA